MRRVGIEPNHVLRIRQFPPTRWAPAHGSHGWIRTSISRINNPLPYRLGDVGKFRRACGTITERASLCPGLVSNQRPPSRQDGALPLSYQDVAGVRFERRLQGMSLVWFHSTTPAAGRQGLEPCSPG